MPRTKTTRNSFGSIFPRKIKRAGRTVTVYDARKRYKDPEGNPREKFKRCDDYAEAMITLANFNNEITGSVIRAAEPPSAHRLHELVEDFRTNEVVAVVYSNGEKIKGYAGNLTHINTILDEIKTYFADDPELPQITFARLKQFKQHLQSTLIKRHPRSTKPPKLPSLSTVNEKLAFLNRVLTVAFEKEWIAVNPFKKGKGLIKQSRRKKRNRPMTFAEEIALYDVCQPHDQVIPVERMIKGTLTKYTQTFHIDRRNLWRLIIASADTGLRAGEVFKLAWWQIDLDRRVIYLTEGAAEQTKTGEPGILPMTARLFDLFTSIYKDQSGDRKVFVKFDYRTAYQNACREAGIIGLQFRDLRNTASTRMELAGNPRSQVMKVTRHTTESTFQNSYVSVDLINAQKIGSSLDLYIAQETEKARRKENAKEKAALTEDAKAA